MVDTAIDSDLYDHQLKEISTKIDYSPYYVVDEHWSYLSTIQPLFTKMISNIAKNHKYLIDLHKKKDQFSSYLSFLLHEIDNILTDFDCSKLFDGGLFRNDFMHSGSKPFWKQVEFNTIAVAFAGISHFLSRSATSGSSAVIPSSAALLSADYLLSTAKSVSELNSFSKSCILFVFPDGETNTKDQDFLVSILHKLKEEKYRDAESSISIEYGPVSSIVPKLSFTKPSIVNPDQDTLPLPSLVYDGIPVSVVYLRGGYSPDHYTDLSSDMAHRVASYTMDCLDKMYFEKKHLITETKFPDVSMLCNMSILRVFSDISSCVSVPSVSVQLAGTKLVQHEFTSVASESYKTEPESFSSILMPKYFDSEFCLSLSPIAPFTPKSYTLSKESLPILREICKHPECYVLKPQMEGGGNNIFGVELREELESVISKLEKEEFVEDPRCLIVQRLIDASVQVISPYKRRIVEVGLFSSTLFQPFPSKPHSHSLIEEEEEKITTDKHAYLCRAKEEGTTEGGVCSGYAKVVCLKMGGKGK
ncbi:Glutathione synthase like protein [Aduncisulcus paluster]|uniref:Glutathione synthetase n=1 Tax=Aduncisulcus paluster TaxID=2918883 RepID=A0ABQ5JYC1_9EUKA|nr:Glutathione synthase like protein [Aduncisulcus paluster]